MIYRTQVYRIQRDHQLQELKRLESIRSFINRSHLCIVSFRYGVGQVVGKLGHNTFLMNIGLILKQVHMSLLPYNPNCGNDPAIVNRKIWLLA